jgi:uncharacterized protein with HEPN domain
LLDILDNIEKLLNYSEMTKPEFIDDEVMVSFACYKLISIGEGMKTVADKFKDQYPDIDWKNVIGMKNVLTHDYYDMNPNIVYSTIKNDLPILCEQVRKILVDNNWLIKTE